MSTRQHRQRIDPTFEGVYERLLPDNEWHRRRLAIPGHGPVSLLERGDGPPLVLLHGTGSPGPFFAPLLRRLDSVRTIVPDRPGHGLTEPVDLPDNDYRRAAVAWIDALLDALELDSTSVLGHSMGGLWALWYAMAHPRRVDRLVVIGPPQLPGTATPLPYRVMATPGLWRLVQRFVRPTPQSVHRFATAMGEGDAILDHPDLIDLLVAVGRHPTSAATRTDEGRAIVSPLALVTPTGFRRHLRVQPDELRRLHTETLVMWGQDEPLGGADVAANVVSLMPNARLEVVPGGHAPWLAAPRRVARSVSTFLSCQAEDAAHAPRPRETGGVQTAELSP